MSVLDVLLLLWPNILGLLGACGCPSARQEFQEFQNFTVSFCGLKVIRSDSSRHSEVGECFYPFRWGQTEELSQKAGPREGQVQLQLCRQELQRQAESLKLSARFWLLYTDEESGCSQSCLCIKPVGLCCIQRSSAGRDLQFPMA